MALLGLVLSPALARAEDTSVIVRNNDSAEVKMVELKKLLGREHKGAGAVATRLSVRTVAQAWHGYRATVRDAEHRYKKSEHAARGVLTQALRAAVKVKDGAVALTALDVYFKSDMAADEKLDEARAKAREDLVVAIKGLLF